MKMSSLPFGTVRFDDEESFAPWFDDAEAMGLDGVELIYSWPVSWHLIHRTHKRLAAHHLEVSMVTSSRDTAKFTDDLRRAEADSLIGYVDLATDFGSRYVRVLAGMFDRTWREVSVSRAIDAVVQTFEMVLPHAEKAGVVLALENHPGFGVALDVVSAVLERLPSPHFGWNFDMENAYRLPDQTAFDFLDDPTILGRLVHVHAKNFGNSPAGWISDVALDEGGNDVRAMLARVKASGYDDWVSIEFGGSTPDKVKRSARWLRDTWERLPSP